MVSSWSSVLYVIHTIQLKRKGQDMWYQYTNIYINEYQWHGSIGMCFFGPRSQTLLARLRSTSINWSIPSNTRNTSITLLPFFVSFDDDCFDSVSTDSNRSIAPTNMPLFHTLTGWEASQKGWWVNWQMRGYIPKCAAQHLLVAVCPFGECHFRGMTKCWLCRKASQKGLRPWCRKSEIGLCQSAPHRPTDVHRNNCMERNGKSRVTDRTRQTHSLNIPKPGRFEGPVSLRNGLICLIWRTTIQNPAIFRRNT